MPCLLGMPFCGNVFLFPWRNSPTGPGSPHCRDFTDTMGRIPLDEWSARWSDIYLVTHNYYDRHLCHRRVSKPAIPASERPQTDALHRASTGIGVSLYYLFQILNHPTGDLSLWCEFSRLKSKMAVKFYEQCPCWKSSSRRWHWRLLIIIIFMCRTAPCSLVET
jgi:hypothetical protein